MLIFQITLGTSTKLLRYKKQREKKGNFAARSLKFHSWRFRKEEINNIRELICFLLDNLGKLFTRSDKETDQFKN